MNKVLFIFFYLLNNRLASVFSEELRIDIHCFKLIIVVVECALLLHQRNVFCVSLSHGRLIKCGSSKALIVFEVVILALCGVASLELVVH